MFPDHACLDHVVTCMSGPYLDLGGGGEHGLRDQRPLRGGGCEGEGAGGGREAETTSIFSK